MSGNAKTLEEFAPETYRFYRHAFEIMQGAKIPFLTGGAYAFAHYTGIARHTKDLDLFVHQEHAQPALDAFAAAGYRGEVVFTHWLAKVYHQGDFIDLIYSSGNGVCPVTDDWFESAPRGDVLGVQVSLMPAEEMIWQKAYIMERERFDGADVNHLIRALGKTLDWKRLLARFGPHWRVLLAHLVLFGFVYPDDRQSIPEKVMRILTSRLGEKPAGGGDDPLCQGTLLSRMQYLADTEDWGYADARLAPVGAMSEDEVTQWTDAGR